MILRSAWGAFLPMQTRLANAHPELFGQIHMALRPIRDMVWSREASIHPAYLDGMLSLSYDLSFDKNSLYKGCERLQNVGI